MNLGFEQKNKKQLKNTIFENFLTEDKEAESNRLYKLYFVFGLTLGIIFSLLIPIRTVPDETYHIVQSYEVSNIIMGTSSRDGYCMMTDLIIYRQHDIQNSSIWNTGRILESLLETVKCQFLTSP